MSQKIKLFAICGSTRAQSSNLTLLKAIRKRYQLQFETNIWTGLDALPAFNPDLDKEPAPAQVSEFRKLLRDSDAVIICSPEYAMGVPGSLKNAIDWTVSSMEFSKKSTALITASSQGHKAHASLLETLRILEAMLTEEQQLLVSFIKTRLDAAGNMDEDLTEKMDQLMAALYSDATQRLALSIKPH